MTIRTDIDADTWLHDLHLDHGAHSTPADGMCVMEAVAWITGSDFNDTPDCVSPVIRAFAISWNDGLNDEERNRLLKPLMLDMIGTNTGVDEDLAWMATDWLVRVQAPVWLRLVGLTDQADQLAGLQPLNADTTPPILPALKAVRSDAAAAWFAAWSADAAAAWFAAWSADAAAAWFAAWSAAWFAAWSAARSAAGDAAWSAARSAAWFAARSAARSAAGDAAWSAARSAARSAAGDAAWSAAWSAARSAAGDAAWSAAGAAAGAALRPGVDELQSSAVDLLQRMSAHAKAAA